MYLFDSFYRFLIQLTNKNRFFFDSKQISDFFFNNFFNKKPRPCLLFTHLQEKLFKNMPHKNTSAD